MQNYYFNFHDETIRKSTLYRKPFIPQNINDSLRLDTTASKIEVNLN